jgi:predicted MarR family transcription regulator
MKKRKPACLHDINDVLRYLIWYKRRNNGNSPSIREIGRACHISSTSHVHWCLVKLQKLGKITVGAGARSISVVGGRWIYAKREG